ADPRPDLDALDVRKRGLDSQGARAEPLPIADGEDRGGDQSAANKDHDTQQERLQGGKRARHGSLSLPRRTLPVESGAAPSHYTAAPFPTMRRSGSAPDTEHIKKTAEIVAKRQNDVCTLSWGRVIID